MFDVSLALPCCASYVDRAAREPLRAAAVHERAKRALYGSIWPHIVVSFAMESFGGLGKSARKFFDSCVQRRQDRLFQEEEDATWSTRSFSTYWLQRMVVGLHGSQG